MTVSPPEDSRPHTVLASMASAFVLLAAVFAIMGVADALDGRHDTRAGATLRAEDSDFFWKQVRTTFMFSGFTLLAAGGCFVASVALQSPSKPPASVDEG